MAKSTVKNNKKEEWIWVEGYKGTDVSMQCRGYQFELGKRFDMPEDAEIETCNSGFHLCLKLTDVYNHYSIGDGNRFFKVKALVRKSDFDEANVLITYNVNSPSEVISHLALCMSGKDTKLAARSIEFISELTTDEILAHLDTKGWTEKYKQVAIERGPKAVEKLIEDKKRAKNVTKLVRLGYSRPFAEVLCNKGYFDKALAVGTQTDLSMDMKVLYILHDELV